MILRGLMMLIISRNKINNERRETCMPKYPNRIVTNRKSPSNEADLINAYKELNPRACRKDNLDIAAVRTKDGTPGHALLNQSINRSKDRDNHIGQNFIPDKELKKQIKK